MPFTFSHPALALPFRRNGFILKYFELIVIGSMSPDFEYFLRLNIESRYSHTFLGLLYFCVPISLIIFYLYLYLIKPRINEYFLKEKRPVKNPITDISSFLAALLAITIGAFSHVLWDSFTHATGFFVIQFKQIFTSPIMGIPLFKVLQHGSTLVGGIVIIGFITHMLKNKKVYIFQKLSFFTLTFFCIFISLGLLIRNELLDSIGKIVVCIISFSFYALLTSSLMMRIYDPSGSVGRQP